MRAIRLVPCWSSRLSEHLFAARSRVPSRRRLTGSPVAGARDAWEAPGFARSWPLLRAQLTIGRPGWSMSGVGRSESPGMVVWMGDEPDVRAWVNADQAAGEFRVRYAELFDAEARLHEQRLHAAANVGAAEHVLDIGCGTGRSTRAAGRAAVAGTVLGVDISAPVLELARRL